MNLEKLIQGAPGSNAAFILPDSSTLDGLVEQCRLVGKAGYIDVKKVNVAYLIRLFSEYEIVVLTNLENLNDKHELLYCLSCLLDFEEPYVMCIINEKISLLNSNMTTQGHYIYVGSGLMILVDF